MDLTTHYAAGYGVERGLYRSHAYRDAAGNSRFGAAGMTVDQLAADSYRREASASLADLTTIAAAMVETDRRAGTDDAGQLAIRLRELGDDTGDDTGAMSADGTEYAPAEGWTADYRDGGRPITGETRLAVDYTMTDQPVPDAPDLSAAGRGTDAEIGNVDREPVDGMTDEELDEIDRARAAAVTDADGDRS